MADKQIIDGCPYQGECSLSGCKRNDDGCFVRQLFEERYRAESQIVDLNKTIKAKEQECEMLKIEAEKWESAFTLDTKMLDNAEVRANKLEQELDQLKAKNEELNDLNTRLDNQRETYWKEYQKLKQTLIEVKEIINQGVKIHDDIIVSKQILQKLSEVVE